MSLVGAIFAVRVPLVALILSKSYREAIQIHKVDVSTARVVVVEVLNPSR